MKPLFTCGLEAVINADTTPPEWIQAAPFGTFETRERDAVQVFNAAAAAEMVSWFNFIPRRVMRLMGINSVPIWQGHPDFAPQEWPQRVQLGHVAELEARADGIYARCVWNEAGLSALRAGHKYPSAAWDCEPINSRGSVKQLKPVMLWSIGMVPVPNIKTAQAVINAAADESPPATDEPTTPEAQTMNPLIQSLITAGLLAEDATEDQAAAAIAQLISNQISEAEISALRIALAAPDEATLSELIKLTIERLGTAATAEVELEQETQINAARITELETLRTTHINSLLDQALAAGLITGAERATHEAALRADLSKGTAALQALTASIKINAPLNIGGARDGLATVAEHQAKIHAWTEARINSAKCSYDEAWQAAKSADELKASFAAITPKKTA